MLHLEQIYHLAMVERKLINASLVTKVNPVVGKSLWPRTPTELTCKVYKRKPLQVVSAKHVKAVKPKREKWSPVTKSSVVTRLDDATIASLNDHYLAVLNSVSEATNRRALIGG